MMGGLLSQEAVVMFSSVTYFKCNIFLEGMDDRLAVLMNQASDIIYLVTAHGHDHRVKASHILGRFVSRERVPRVLPLQE
jgi:hypothetical protein